MKRTKQIIVDNPTHSIFLLVGFLGSAVGIIFTYYGEFSLNYGFIVTLFFMIMFFAGLFGITPNQKSK